MPTLIRNGQVASNDWQQVGMEAGLDSVIGADTGKKILVPLAMWMAEKESLAGCGKEIGVWLESDDDPYELATDVGKLNLIALNFPVFRDGRPFSAAAILRKRLGYRGELRAIGDVLRDQLFYMRQCGIDSFAIGDMVKVNEALDAFNDFATSYQSTVVTPEPLFRRR